MQNFSIYIWFLSFFVLLIIAAAFAGFFIGFLDRLLHPPSRAAAITEGTNNTVVAELFPYRKKLSVMTHAEQIFFRKLEEQYGQEYYIFPQINLDKLIDVDASIWEYKYRNKIDRKSVDFVLVDKLNFETKKVIELDDFTHTWVSRVERDEFVNNIFTRCGIDLVREKIN